jgi:hypothetical protein
MWDFVAWNMKDASANLRNGSFSDLSLLRLGNALHTVQDYTSPMHTTSAGEPRPWFGDSDPRSLPHPFGENSPNDDWSAIGFAIRLTMAAFLQVNPEQAKAHGLTPATFEKEAENRISQYIDYFWYDRGFQSEGQREAARQCAFGNPAACGF